MKKILFSAAIAIASAGATHAGSLYIVNSTGCTIYGITQGGTFTAPPGNTFFASPANVSNPAATPSGSFTGVTFDVNPMYMNPVYVGYNFFSSCTSASGTSTACNGGASFCWSWVVNTATSDIVLLYY